MKFRLWDEDEKQFVTFREARKKPAPHPVPKEPLKKMPDMARGSFSYQKGPSLHA